MILDMLKWTINTISFVILSSLRSTYNILYYFSFNICTNLVIDLKGNSHIHFFPNEHHEKGICALVPGMEIEIFTLKEQPKVLVVTTKVEPLVVNKYREKKKEWLLFSATHKLFLFLNYIEYKITSLKYIIY